MIPVGALVAGVIVAARLAARTGHVPHRSARGSWMVFVSVVVMPLWLLLTASLFFSNIQGGPATTLAAILLALLPIVVPWALARYLLVPLGLVRPAYYLNLTPDWTWMKDPRGGAALAAAWALLRRPVFDPELAAWVEQRLADTRAGKAGPPLRGAGITAAGLVAAARGDLDAARVLLTSVRDIDAMANPAAAQRIALDWLVADAAARGAWDEVASEGRQPGASRTARLMACIADRLLGKPDVLPAWRLWLAWLMCSQRFALLPMVRHAIEGMGAAAGEASRSDALASQETEAPRDPETGTAAHAGGAAWEAALIHHAALFASDAGGLAAPELVELGRRWEQAFGDRTAQRHFNERAMVLGAARSHEAWSGIMRAVEDDLASLARAAGVSLSDLRQAGGMTARAADTLREELLGELELAGTALRARVDAERVLSPVDEWREFIGLTRAYARAVELGGIELRRLAFSRLKNDVWSHAYWLSSERGENTLANAMYRWELAEAQAVGDSRAIEPLTGNVDATAATDPRHRS